MSKLRDPELERRLRLDAALASAYGRASPLDVPALLRDIGGGGDEAALPVLDAAEAVLSAYDEHVPLLSAAALARVSAANLRDLSLALTHRPPLFPPALAALLQLAVLAARHAPPTATDGAGRVLCALLDLLACLPRAGDEAETALRVARVAARNVLRRAAPRLLAAPGRLVDAALLPWAERHLVALRVVSGAAARADLRADRRLALTVLDACLRGAAPDLPRRIALRHAADAARALLRDEALDRGEREAAADFLRRAAAVGGEAPFPAPPLGGGRAPARAAADFLREKDAAYVAEFGGMRRHTRAEGATGTALRQRRRELQAERDELMGELRGAVEGAAADGATDKDNGTNREGWADRMMRLVQRMEELTIAQHEEQMRRQETASVL